MPLQDRLSGRPLASLIELLDSADYAWLKRSSEFKFNWKLEQDNEVFKIYLTTDPENILGVISITDKPTEYRIHINLIEVAESQRGRKKTIDNIAGCLIAFTCRLAFAKKYLGFVSLNPKTMLIDHYQNAYGFRQYGRLLGIEQDDAMRLVQKYLQDEKK